MHDLIIIALVVYVLVELICARLVPYIRTKLPTDRINNVTFRTLANALVYALPYVALWSLGLTLFGIAIELKGVVLWLGILITIYVLKNPETDKES